jgi:hypothetical protein
MRAAEAPGWEAGPPSWVPVAVGMGDHDQHFERQPSDVPRLTHTTVEIS